jgi:quercetin dioxygenase-like cupin family protein
MHISLPHSIENPIGEKIIFHAVVPHPEGEKLLAENFVAPNIGPVMHTHWLQDEVFTVVNGNLGYEIAGQGKKFAGPGDTVFFKRGIPHRFWNAGTDILHCKGYVQPAYNTVFFLSSLFAAQQKSGTAKPALFEIAFLATRYKSEFDITDMPAFVKTVVVPVVYFLGKLLGKYKQFAHAPAAVKA